MSDGPPTTRPARPHAPSSVIPTSCDPGEPMTTVRSERPARGRISARLLDVQVVRFVVVGVVNTAFAYGIYAMLLYAGLSYAVANLIALICGILFSFKTQGAFVFRRTANHLLGRFVLSWALIYLVTIAIVGRLIAFGFNAYIAGALAIPFSTALSFLSQKYFVFRRDER